MAKDLFDLIEEYQKDIQEALLIKHYQTITRWLKTRKISPTFKRQVIEYLKEQGEDITL